MTKPNEPTTDIAKDINIPTQEIEIAIDNNGPTYTVQIRLDAVGKACIEVLERSEAEIIGSKFENRFREVTKGSNELSVRRIIGKVIHVIRLLQDPKNAKALCGDVLAHVHGTRPRNEYGLDMINRDINAILINHVIGGHGETSSLPLFQNGSTIVAWMNLDHVADNLKNALNNSSLKKDEEICTAVQNLMEATANRDVISYRKCLEFLLPFEESLGIQISEKARDSMNAIETARKN